MQINRLFEIIYILLDKKTATAKELAEYFEVSTRTIYRDVETLSSAGIPIFMSKGKGGGISLISGYVLNKAVLTDNEKTNILSSLKAFSSVDLSEQDSTLNKLSAMLGDKNTDWIEVDFSNWSDGGKEKKLFANLKIAIINKNIVNISYSNGKGEISNREIEPLKLCFKGQSWYVYSFCQLKKDYRFFKLTRISKLEIMAEKFERDTPKQILTEETYHTQQSETVKLKISKKFAFRVYDEFPQYEIDENGDFIVDVFISDKNWLHSYICTFGQHAEILEPKHIRNDFIKYLQDTLKNYL